MIVAGCQRWRERRGTYRPAGEPFNPRGWEVAPVSEGVAKAFVTTHHYSRSYPAARVRFGLMAPGGALMGVAVYSEPVTRGVFLSIDLPPSESVECGRLVLLDQVRSNAESWFIARTHHELHRLGYAAVVSMADPVPRSDLRGQVVHPGHLGVVYQATNAAYLGRATRRSLRILPCGSVFSGRARQKVLSGERGHAYAEAQLVTAGAAPRGDEAPAVWLARWLPIVTRPLTHPGNHRYAWWLARRHHQKALAHWAGTGLLQPYPKLLEAL